MSHTGSTTPHGKSDVRKSLNHASVTSAEDSIRHATSQLSLDDIEAALTLEKLRAGFFQSPSSGAREHDHPSGSVTRIDSALPSPHSTSNPCHSPQDAEPLLSLVTSHHPLLSTAVNRSRSVYTTSKSYSPRFKSSAEFVERNIGSPVVSTITTAGRISGFNSSVRWLYGGTSPGTHGGRLKRRRPTDDHEVDETDVEKGLSDGFPPLHHVDSGGFMPETLPPYDPEGRSPMYELHGGSTQPGREHPPPSDRSLGTRLLMTTSGLQAALNDRSLKSLKYCLSWLRWTSHNVGNMTTSLRSAIQEYHESGQQPPKQPTADADGDMRMSSEFSDRSKTVQSMRTLKSGIVDGINHVIDIVSTYAGGALPENARNLVQRQILSLPSRFNLASPRNNMEGPPDQSTSAQGVEAQSSPTRDIQTQTPPGSTNSVVRPSSEPEKCSPENEAKSAKRVVIFAEQALDMITQVSGVIAGTVQSAEDWLDRFDRRPRSAGDGEDRQLQRKPSLYKSGTPQIVLNEKETFRLVDEKEG